MKNAKITSAHLGLDNGTFTARICVGVYIDGQVFDGGSFDYVAASPWVAGVLKCAGVEAWQDLPGKLIRVEYIKSGDKIKRIAHITDDEIYFDAKEWMEQCRAAEAESQRLSQSVPPLDTGAPSEDLDFCGRLGAAFDHDFKCRTKGEVIEDLSIKFSAEFLSRGGLMGLCWNLASDASEDPDLRAKALGILAEVTS